MANIADVLAERFSLKYILRYLGTFAFLVSLLIFIYYHLQLLQSLLLLFKSFPQYLVAA